MDLNSARSILANNYPTVNTQDELRNRAALMLVQARVAEIDYERTTLISLLTSYNER